MTIFWGLWAAGSIALAWSERRKRGGLFWLGALLAPLLVALFVLTGLDNMKSEVVDCQRVFDPATGGDVLSCREDHWLPTRIWRVINRF